MTGARPPSHGRSVRDIISDAGAGAAAGAIAATFVCPLDVIKTRLQVHGLPMASGSSVKGSIIMTSLQDIVKREGFQGMYRGLSPTILALLPNWAVYFTVYEHLKGVLRLDGWFSSHFIWIQLFLTGLIAVMVILIKQEGIYGVFVENGNGQLSVGKNMIAAAGAGAATAFTTNPLWVVKTRLQTQGMRTDVVPYKSIASALRRIAYEEGIRGLYSGLLPSLAGISHVAIQFPAYEKIKFFLAEREHTTVDKLSAGNVAIASSLSKIVASLMTYPHEVVRSRLQEQGQVRSNKMRYAGVFDCIRKVFQVEGLPGFYRGCATNLLRTVPSAVITFTSYEMIRRFFTRAVPPATETPHPCSRLDDHSKPHMDVSKSERDQSSNLAHSIPVSKGQLSAR